MLFICYVTYDLASSFILYLRLWRVDRISFLILTVLDDLMYFLQLLLRFGQIDKKKSIWPCLLINLGNVDVDVFGYKFYIHSCLSPSGWIWTKSTSMRGCWVASQYGPHSLVPLARLGHIEKQPSILACWLIFKNIPLGCPRGIFSHIHPSGDIQECISNRVMCLGYVWVTSYIIFWLRSLYFTNTF